MAHTRARVDGATLVTAAATAGPITVGTPAWFAWLEEATAFTFTSSSGSFTARKERRSRGGWYWKAYHTANGTLQKAYLGKLENLTLERLERAAVTLASASTLADPLPEAPPPTPAAVPPNLLATKLFIPPARAQLVSRPRLLDHLQRGLQGKLTLISAPAGFGKTTLVGAWVAACGRPVAWLSLDEGDADPARFLTYLVAALQTIAPTIGMGAMVALQSPQPPPVESMLTALLNEITSVPDAFILILDDYHVIDARAVDEVLAFLLEHLPPRMHLVITTREDPLFPMARLRARAHMTELRAVDLRFTSSEAAAFLKDVMGLDLSTEDVTALESRTEGWIAGLQLAALSLQGHHDAASFITSFTGSDQFIMDYLVEEVLHRQSASVQAFLLRTSILDRLCGPLCDAVLLDHSASGQDTLQYLQHANLFIIPLDTERRWYRYHHLFADLLRQRLHQRIASTPPDERTDVADFHTRASQWYEDNGLEIEAFQHAAATDDVARVERLIEGKGVPLHFSGTGTPVLTWLRSLPTAVLDARPSLWVTYASACMMTGQPTAVEPKLQAAEAALAQRAPDAERDDTTRDLVGRIASLRATLAIIHHDAETIITQSRRALRYLHPDNLPLRTAASYTLGYAYQIQGDRVAANRAYSDVIMSSTSFGASIYTTAATLGLGQVQEADNQLSFAAETYRRVLLLAGDPPRPIASNAHLGLARIFYQWNDLQAAEQHGQQCVHLTQQMEGVDTFAACGVVLAHLRLARGDVSGAIALLDEAEAFVRRHDFLFRMPDVAAAQVLTLLRQGNLAAAAHLAQTHDLPLSRARIHLAQGDSSTALAVLHQVRFEAEAKGWADERLKVMVIEALALRAHGKTDEAVHVLHEALALAEPGGFIRVFVDEGVPMAQLLSEAAARGTMSGSIDTLLPVFEAGVQKSEDSSYLPLAPPAQPLSEPLSHRETEILQLMAQGLSNREISERLFLALSTVKGHNQTIFGKLQVQRRTEAVARARELGLA
jgi:LuxR family maltose regulon positive regulatory protein